MAVGFYGTLTLLVVWRLRGLRRWAVVLGGLVLVLLIGFSRMYLGVTTRRTSWPAFSRRPCG
jgi:membrane-associated phospholipid phosphatase